MKECLNYINSYICQKQLDAVLGRTPGFALEVRWAARPRIGVPAKHRPCGATGRQRRFACWALCQYSFSDDSAGQVGYSLRFRYGMGRGLGPQIAGIDAQANITFHPQDRHARIETTGAGSLGIISKYNQKYPLFWVDTNSVRGCKVVPMIPTMTTVGLTRGMAA